MPVPTAFTVSTAVFGIVLKLAVTCWLALRVIVQAESLPLHPPVHPANDEPTAGVSLRVISVPLTKLALQVGAQLIPDGLLATVPVPVPAAVTAKTAAV